MRHGKLTRRRVLQATGGLALGLPLLSALRAKADEETFPKRLVLMFTPNGVIHEGWWPTVTSETEFQLGAIHAPLEAYRDRLLIMKGIENSVAKNLTTGGPHQKGIGGLYTGQGLQTGTFVDGCGAQAGWADGISVDQRAAGVIGANTPLKSLELGVRALENDVQGRISYAGAGQPLPPMNQPLDVYNRLIQAPGFSDIPPADPVLARRRSVLDAVYSQFDLVGKRVGADDRAKLEGHLELVRDLERRMSASGNGLCAQPEEPPLLDPSSEVDMPTIAELEVDLLALSFACDLTRVGSLQIGTSLNRIRYPWVDSLGEGHTLSHSADEGSKAQLVARGKWHAGLLARLCDRLSEIKEGDGTALDNTVMVWCSEVSMGTTHAHTDMPFLVIGGGWHFRTGRYLELGGVSHSGLLVSLLNALGVEDQTFGNAEFAVGALSAMS
jgi:hypothetical protein